MPSRRRVLQGLIGAALAGGAGVALVERRRLRLAIEDPNRIKRFVRDRLAPGLPDAAPAPLSGPVRRALAGFLQAYLPPSAADAATVAALVEFADGEARMVTGFGKALEEGLGALGGGPGAPLFAEGSGARRDAALRERFTEPGLLHYLRPAGRTLLRFRHIVLPALLRELAASGAIWRTVRYRKYPGLCGDPRAYTERPG